MFVDNALSQHEDAHNDDRGSSRHGSEKPMAADPECARCKRPIGPGWLYLTVQRRGQAEVSADGTVFIHVPGECPRPGEHAPPS